MTLEHVLLIIITVFLVIFLLAGIFATVAVIALVKKLHSLADKAEGALDHVGDVAKIMGKRLAPAAFSAMVAAALKQWRNHKDKGGDDD